MDEQERELERAANADDPEAKKKLVASRARSGEGAVVMYSSIGESRTFVSFEGRSFECSVSRWESLDQAASAISEGEGAIIEDERTGVAYWLERKDATPVARFLDKTWDRKDATKRAELVDGEIALLPYEASIVEFAFDKRAKAQARSIPEIKDLERRLAAARQELEQADAVLRQAVSGVFATRKLELPAAEVEVVQQHHKPVALRIVRKAAVTREPEPAVEAAPTVAGDAP